MARGEESHTNFDELQIARTGAAELQRGTVLAGRYEIEALLGRGGAGVVLRAHDRELHEAVAIKVLRPELAHATRWIERLAREVKLARQLRHPNVCRVFDFEKADGHVFIVMELATGGTLRTELEEGVLQRRTLEERLADARAVAAGLAAIHEAGIAHRDVTPQNVLRMADGRLIVSDFGLATEVSQTTTSLHGGTLAYMAPEVVRGQRGTFASDVWALGVVVHEIVFGARPTWSKAVGGTLLPPTETRTLARGERLAFSVCRACTEENPPQRPRAAREVEVWLAGRQRVKHRARPPVIAAALLVACAIAAVVALEAVRSRLPQSVPAAPEDALMLHVEPGAPDWTQSTKVLATVDGDVRCLTRLPDRRTLRYVKQTVGSPPQAVDFDTVTGQQRPSRLVGEAFAEGCPDVSPDGHTLVFQGYAPDGSAHAFVSTRDDGAHATPVVAIADPSVSSEPKWAPDGQSFVFDADARHAGTFSMITRRATILPDPTRGAFVSMFKFITERQVYLDAILSTDDGSEFVGLTLPALTEETRFRLPGFDLDALSFGEHLLVSSRAKNNYRALLVEVAPKQRRARELGRIEDHSIRDPVFVDGGLAFRSWRLYADLWTKGKGKAGTFERLTDDAVLTQGKPCGESFIATENREDGSSIVRVDQSGHIVERLTKGPKDHSPSCSSVGDAWFYISGETLRRCDHEGCRPIGEGPFGFARVSPDGRRIVVVRMLNAGFVTSVLPSDGGPTRDIAVSETICEPGWSSNDELWISRRKASGLVWTEVDAQTGKETKRAAVPGTSNCSRGGDDPASPVITSVRSVARVVTQIRLAPRALLDRPWPSTGHGL